MPPKKTSGNGKTHAQMAKEAIIALKERGGSSPVAIKAWITKTHPSFKLVPHQLKAALKKGVESKKLVKVKASYKVGAMTR
jgi:histone H1/5